MTSTIAHITIPYPTADKISPYIFVFATHEDLDSWVQDGGLTYDKRGREYAYAQYAKPGTYPITEMHSVPCNPTLGMYMRVTLFVTRFPVPITIIRDDTPIVCAGWVIRNYSYDGTAYDVRVIH